MKRFLALLLVVVMVLSLSLAGCSNNNEETTTKAPEQTTSAPEQTTEGTTEPAEPKTFTLGVTADPESLDCHAYYGNIVQDVLTAVNENLVRQHNGSIIPSGAESWTISEDGLVWTFKIREGMTWTDGSVLDANDYYDAFERLMNPNTFSSFGSAMASYFANGEAYNAGTVTDFAEVGVKVLDNNTLELTLANPCGYFLNILSMSCFLPIHKDSVVANGETYGSEANKQPYCGPFYVEYWAHEEKIVLTKNENYWNAAEVNFDTVTLQTITSNETRALMYEQGDLDYTNVATSLVTLYNTRDDFKTRDSGSLTHLLVKQDHELLKNLNLRLALGWSIDRAGLCASLLNNTAVPALRFVPSIIAGANGYYTEEHPEVTNWAPNADLEKAKSFMTTFRTEAGIGDEAVELKLMTGDSELLRQVAEYLQDLWLTELNVNLTLDLQPSSTRWATERAGGYDVDISGWSPDFGDPLGNLCALEDGSNWKHNAFHTSEATAQLSASFTDLINKSKAEVDPVTRIGYLAEAEKIIVDNSIIIPIYFSQTCYMMDPAYSDIFFNVSGPDIDFIYGDYAA